MCIFFVTLQPEVAKVMSKETFMIESLTQDVVALLMEEKGLSMREAMDVFCTCLKLAALNKLLSE